MERNILNTKNEQFIIQSSAHLLQWKYFLLNNPILEFFVVKNNDGINIWEYNQYNFLQMITNAQSGGHRRGGMNEEGIYVVAGHHSNNTKIYDMKYYDYPDQKLQLLSSFPNSHNVNECFFKNSTCAVCCDGDGYMKEYDLSNPHSIPPPLVFNKIALDELWSCMQTQDKKYIIAGGYGSKLYILDAKDGSLLNTQDYSTNGGERPGQIAEVRPNILITADESTASVHDIRDIQNMPPSFKLPDIGHYRTVISLENNPGDFAIGGWSASTARGYVDIHHLEEDNKTIITVKSVSHRQIKNCDIFVIKEVKRATIIFGGAYRCAEICILNYAAIPSPDPLCWADQTGFDIWDILLVPYKK